MTEDLDKVYTTLMDYRAAGGGDGPEDVRTALAEGLYKAGWSAASPDLAQIIFLVGDAPPHNDYRDEQDTQVTAIRAVQKGIIVNTIQCGNSGETARAWRDIASSGHGEYFAIPADGGVQAITTPYDEQLSELSAKAERAINKVANSEAYVGDLLQSVENGSVKIDAIDPASLPEPLQSMSPADRQQEIERRLAERREIRAQIISLSKQRSDYIAAELKKNGSKESAFDVVVSRQVQRQMKRMKY